MRREITRVRQDLRQWRESGDGLQSIVAGWGGIAFIVTMVLSAGYGVADTIDDILKLAITPLAVLWGLQHYPRTPPSNGNGAPEEHGVDVASSINPESDDSTSAKWLDRFRDGITKLCQLSGIVAVIAILLIEAVGPLLADIVVRPIAVLSGSVAMMSAIARITANVSPPFLTRETTPKDKTHLALHQARLTGMIWDGLVALGLALVPIVGLSLIWGWLPPGDWGIPGLVVGTWTLYQSVTTRVWGRGVGGRRQHLKVVDVKGHPPGWGRSLTKTVITPIPLIALVILIDTATGNPRRIYSIIYALFFVTVFALGLKRSKRSFADAVAGTQVIRTTPH